MMWSNEIIHFELRFNRSWRWIQPQFKLNYFITSHYIEFVGLYPIILAWDRSRDLQNRCDGIDRVMLLLTWLSLVKNETTYSFPFLGTDNIPRKPIETVMHHISTDPASTAIAWVTLSRKSIDKLLREQIDFCGESKETNKGGISLRGYVWKFEFSK